MHIHETTTIFSFLQFILPPCATLLAGYIGVKFGLEQVKLQKRLDFIERQLRDFYSPILGIHQNISTKGKLRFKISGLHSKEWKDMSEKERDKKLPFVEKVIEYDNDQWKKDLLPLYHKIADIFTQNYWLAEPETKEHYMKLIEYVEVWDRWLDKAITIQTVSELINDDNELEPFFKEIDYRSGILRKELAFSKKCDVCDK